MDGYKDQSITLWGVRQKDALGKNPHDGQLPLNDLRCRAGRALGAVVARLVPSTPLAAYIFSLVPAQQTA